MARAAMALGAEVRAVALSPVTPAAGWPIGLAEERIPGRWAWADGETRSCLAIHEAADGSSPS